MTRIDANRHGLGWMLSAMAVVIVVALGLRWGTGILAHDTVRDEHLMKAPIDAILEQGWSIETALDYQEVKGPAFFWSYALAGKVLGGEMNDLRLVSVFFFLLAAPPLLLVARRCGIEGPGLVAVGGFYALSIYNAPQGQLLMSEPSFVCFGAWMLWTLVRGLEAPEGSPWRRWGPVAFAVLLAVLLHHRPHVAAIVGATAAVSWALMGRQCLPWLVACAAAGLSRVPLYLRWDGLVTSDYQGLHGPGLSMPTLTYMLAAVLPVLGIFLLRAWTDPALRASRKWVAAVGGCGVLLALAAMPDLADRIAYDHPALGPKEQVNYAGIVGTAVRTITSTALLQSILLAIMAALGAASLAAAWIVAASHRVATAAGLVLRLSVLTLAIGLPMTAMTTGPAYDRYLQVWCILLPVAWVAALPRGLQVLQGVGLAVMLVFFVGRHLV